MIQAGLAGSALAFGGSRSAAADAEERRVAAAPVPAGDERARPASGHPLRILILGGTGFLGPHLIAYAQDRGHAVSIFTRGRTEPTINRQRYREVEHLTGDRNGDLGALEGRQWDAVIDNSGYRAEWTRGSARLLRDNVGLYVYTSSTGVYYPYLGDAIDETTELVTELTPGIPDNEDSQYGIMKVQSEIEARMAFGEDRTLVVRPTYIVGPGDRSNRFPYWPVRLERGGAVMVPGKANDPIQLIDARDLTGWMIRLIETGRGGTFNVAGPSSPMGMHAFVHGVHAATSSAVEWVMVDDYGFLLAQEVPYVVPWIMPVDDNYGSARVDNRRAIENGLTFRPLAATSLDVLDWWHSDAVTDERRTALTEAEGSLMAREARIIAAWRGR